MSRTYGMALVPMRLASALSICTAAVLGGITDPLVPYAHAHSAPRDSIWVDQKLQYDSAPSVLPLRYYLSIQAHGPREVFRHFVLKIDHLQGWRVLAGPGKTKPTAAGDCGKRRVSQTPLSPSATGMSWDFGRVVFPPRADIVSNGTWFGDHACWLGITLKPTFRLRDNPMGTHLFRVQLIGYTGGWRTTGSRHILKSFHWDGSWIQGPS